MEGGGVMLVSPVDFKLSKVEILRGIVCEKLTTAAQEILAVVERTLSGYEEEAAGLRREIERQKNQLEAVLQPRVSLSRIEPARQENNGGELPQNKTEQTDGGDSASWVCLKQDEEEDAGEKELDKNEGGALNLQVCLLQDAHADMPTRNVFKSSVQEVTCPPGLKEAEFLDLLRSTFPGELSGEFEAFTVDVTRKLTPLNLEAMTPKNIDAAIKSRGNGRSALYIRVKAVKESQSSLEQTPSSAIKDQTVDDATNEEQGSHASSSSSPAERAESRQQLMEPREDVEHGGTSEDFSAHRAADSDDGDDDVEDRVDDRDEEWKPSEHDKRNSPKTVKKTPSVVRTKRRKQIRPPLKATTENSGVPLSCKVCQALSSSNNMLIKHSWSHVEDPERLCGVCGERSASPEELRSHLNSHKKTYSCDVCGKNFISLSGLQRHALLHTGERPFKCDVCDKTYSCISNLKNHRWEHSEEKRYKCDVCDESFAVKRLARIHCRGHTGEKPFTCDLCGKSVSDLRSLSRHKLIHFGQRRHSCQVCGKHFLTPVNLKEHEKIHSDRVKTFLCDICCKTFYTPGELRVHLRSHSEEKVMCGVCGKGLSSKGALKRHLTTHNGERPHGCPVCGQTFKRRTGLRSHMKLHSGVKAFVCSVCGKACSRKEYLIVHMRTHNGEKPYKCSVCDKSFTQSHCLKTHMKSHQREEEDGLKD